MSVTFFTTPKPWIKEFANIQTTAINSWVALDIGDVVLISNDDVPSTVQSKIKKQYNVKCNEWGTPLVNDIFSTIQKNSSDGLCCFINCDIVLSDNFKETIKALLLTPSLSDAKQWLAIGQRIDLNLETNVLTQHSPHGIDYFIFPKGTFPFVYPFALGKFVYDQWLVGNVHRRGLPVIDCTNTITALHLNGPWYFQNTAETDRNKIELSDESKKNASFDYYVKNIITGSTMKTVMNPDKGIIVVAET